MIFFIVQTNSSHPYVSITTPCMSLEGTGWGRDNVQMVP